MQVSQVSPTEQVAQLEEQALHKLSEVIKVSLLQGESHFPAPLVLQLTQFAAQAEQVLVVESNPNPATQL